MIKDRQKQLAVWAELNKRLAGKCGDYCPKEFNSKWSCMNCVMEFGFIRSLIRQKDLEFTGFVKRLKMLDYDTSVYPLKISFACPCYSGANKEEILLHLEELAEEAKNEN